MVGVQKNNCTTDLVLLQIAIDVASNGSSHTHCKEELDWHVPRNS